MSTVRVVDVRVSGHVQGVGFRWFVLRCARALGLTGWVRNTEDGEVEVRVAGDATRVSQLIDALRRGPAHARVEAVEIQERETAEVQQNTEFEIIP